ncbi:ArsR/SmtB family transcription factor [Arthrobacter dokdonensis]|uniref:ArsR/SmtB family transcription factor n=1 Tax=Arthrobacter dokdonellae TaxID=2211210 RepID=UPI000DE5AB81|nr:metalloregulator ArsR/SmtB family transcription factor [Arthrobacter dokdonellae]
MVVEAVFAVIAEGTRRDILEALATEHKAVGQLVEELGVSQPTVSKHLRVLREAGVVTMRAQGQKRYYSINTEPLSMVSEWLHGLGAGAAPLPRPAAASETRERAAATPAPAVALDAKTTAAAPSAVAPAATPVRAAATPAAAPSAVAPAAAAPAVPAGPRPEVTAAVVLATEGDPSVQQQITRSMGRAANKAADLLANLPAFRRRKD